MSQIIKIQVKNGAERIINTMSEPTLANYNGSVKSHTLLHHDNMYQPIALCKQTSSVFTFIMMLSLINKV